ncbi:MULTISPECIES: ABC transporter permease [Chelativorans]|jgi:spermidine/putrescine transport system permease protein|uniref:Binding-protein-dependent transport systems inner membrane component n=1 Tax=Chelativorans sp. (strain BNC1) TaxID=266779 RepID=Q11MY0_CHESB|nr:MULTISPECIES: ABC transporter permease [Chelativorans]
MFRGFRPGKLWSALFNSYGFLFLAFLYMPLALIVVYSFNANPINMAVWTGFTLDWYATIFGGAGVEGTFDVAFTESPERIFEVVKNSFLVATTAASISTLIGTATAVALARYRFAGKRFYQALLLLPMLVPDIVLGIALLIFFVGAGFHLSLLTIVIGHVTFLSSYVFVVVSSRLAGMDTTLEQASADLGAGALTTFRRVTLPLIMPGVLGGFLLAFIISLDDVVITYFIAGVGSQTLPLLILAMMRRGLRPQITALAVVIILFSFAVATVGMLLRNRKS